MCVLLMALLHCVPTLLQPRQSAPLLQQVHKVSFSAWCRSMTHQFSRIQHRADITLLWILCFIPSGASSYTLANTAVSLHHHTYWATSVTTCLSPIHQPSHLLCHLPGPQPLPLPAISEFLVNSFNHLLLSWCPLLGPTELSSTNHIINN